MVSMPVRGLGLCVATTALLCFAASANADPKPLSKAEQAKVDKAVEKAVAYLKRAQTKEGNWPTKWKDRFLVGECALPAYALLEAGVPADDPVIQKAAAFIRPKVADTNYTYELSLAVLFFDRLGDPKDKELLQTCALRLIAGQFWTGGWSYICPRFKEGQEAELLKALQEVSKLMKAKKPAKVALKAVTEPDKDLFWSQEFAFASLELPTERKEFRLPRGLKGFRGLAVFQDVGKLNWREREDQRNGGPQSIPLVGITDNSNTQFALLALWVAQHHDIPTEATFRLLATRFERSQLGWYQYSKNAWSNGSMICVDLLGLAIGRGLKLSTLASARASQRDLHILTRLVALYADIGTPTGQMDNPVPTRDAYFLWSLERVGMLYNLPTLDDKEWYRWGAEVLVSNQLDSGEFNAKDSEETPRLGMARRVPGASTYGPMLKTAFALLFLKHSHPMKDLTPKLPFTVKQLNEGIARLRPRDSHLESSTVSPSHNSKPER
jgi:hypothetical protein